ncbi:hypothetical protein GN956_G18585 [Arapaima gigas]
MSLGASAGLRRTNKGAQGRPEWRPILATIFHPEAIHAHTLFPANTESTAPIFSREHAVMGGNPSQGHNALTSDTLQRITYRQS